MQSIKRELPVVAPGPERATRRGQAPRLHPRYSSGPGFGRDRRKAHRFGSADPSSAPAGRASSRSSGSIAAGSVRTCRRHPARRRSFLELGIAIGTRRGRTRPDPLAGKRHSVTVRPARVGHKMRRGRGRAGRGQTAPSGPRQGFGERTVGRNREHRRRARAHEATSDIGEHFSVARIDSGLPTVEQKPWWTAP